MSEKDAQAANEFNDGLKRLQTSVRAIVLDLGTKLIPVLIQLAELVTTIMTRGRANVLDEMLKGWAGLFVLLTHAIRETSLELEVFYKKLGAAEAVKKFWNDVLVQTRKDLDARRDQELRDIFEGRSSAKTTPLKSGKADVFVPNVTVSAEQAKKKSQEIFDDLEREEKDRLARLHLAAPTYDLGTIQEGLGKAERANFLAAQQQAQTWIDAYQKEEDAALARLDAEIDAYGKAQEAMGRFIVQRTQKERLEQMSVLELYRFGLQEYLTNYGNTFNIAIEMARQTAQAMSQGFKTFFFDFMQGRITSLQDAFRGLVNFVQQVIAEVLARLATAKLLGLIGFGAATSATSSQAASSQAAMIGSGMRVAGGGQVVRRFAIGGPVFSNGDSVPALLTPGEYVISNRGVDALNRLNQGDPGGFAHGGPGNVVVNIHNAPPGTGADVSVLRRSQDFIINVILRDLRQNGPLRQALGAA
jgi:lambda family phage tail tape measure protein